MIKWFNVKDRNGVASLNINSIVLNTTAMYPFDSAYRVQVGIEDKKIIVKPLTKDVVDSGILDECCLLKLEIHKSFSTIWNVKVILPLNYRSNLIKSRLDLFQVGIALIII